MFFCFLFPNSDLSVLSQNSIIVYHTLVVTEHRAFKFKIQHCFLSLVNPYEFWTPILRLLLARHTLSCWTFHLTSPMSLLDCPRTTAHPNKSSLIQFELSKINWNLQTSSEFDLGNRSLCNCIMIKKMCLCNILTLKLNVLNFPI